MALKANKEYDSAVFGNQKSFFLKKTFKKVWLYKNGYRTFAAPKRWGQQIDINWPFGIIFWVVDQ
jgi:hypothetical protein